MKQLLILLISVTTLMISKGYANAGSLVQPAKEEQLLNVTYGSNSLQKMDVYLPAKRSVEHTNVLLLIHGGSWANGDKRDFNYYITALQKQLPEYAIVNMNYRLAFGPSSNYPAQVDDVAAALNYLTKNAAAYAVNADEVVIVGASAGAHLGLLHAYKYNDKRQVKAVVDLFGPTDLEWMYNNHPAREVSQSLLENFMGTAYTSNTAVYKEASPINYITTQAPPTLILHGSYDMVVPVSESKRLQAKLQAAHVVNELVIYPSERHGWMDASLEDTFKRIGTFVRANVK